MRRLSLSPLHKATLKALVSGAQALVLFQGSPRFVRVESVRAFDTSVRPGCVKVYVAGAGVYQLPLRNVLHVKGVAP